MAIQRRKFLVNSVASMLAIGSSLATHRRTTDGSGKSDSAVERIRGMLLGTLIGDAMGGPLEFAKPEARKRHVADCRSWPDSKRLDDQSIAELESFAELKGYAPVRPESAAYGPWVKNAPAGTMTDDSRLKIVLIRALRRASKNDESLSVEGLATAVLEFKPLVDQPPDDAASELLREGMAEYRFAANWLLGERDPKVALPLDRLWGGISNCSGQMMMLPLAAKYAGNPDLAYRQCFGLDFIDASTAKDIAAAIVAGMSCVLGPEADSLSIEERWRQLEATMLSTDPFRLNEVPFVGRPLKKWLDLANSIADRADGRPKRAYELLQAEGKPVYYWDAHFTLLVSMVMLKLTEYRPMAALGLALDFGHDTDSYTQLIGALIGAVCGPDVFAEKMQKMIERRLMMDFGEDISQWIELLKEE